VHVFPRSPSCWLASLPAIPASRAPDYPLYAVLRTHMIHCDMNNTDFFPANSCTTFPLLKPCTALYHVTELKSIISKRCQTGQPPLATRISTLVRPSYVACSMGIHNAGSAGEGQDGDMGTVLENWRLGLQHPIGSTTYNKSSL
jgi:hypothetical protein